VACVFVFGLYASHSHAQLYKWTDENGKVHYTDSIPPSANDRARKELRSDGTVKRETERALTAEEKRLAAVRAAEEAKAREVQAERDRRDKALLATYTDLKDFDRVRDRALATLDSEIRALTERETYLAKVLATPEGKPLPPELAPMVTVSPIAGASATPDKAAPGAPAKPGTPAPAVAAKPAAPKSYTARLLEAKGELPRVTETLNRKRRDRGDLAALYAGERLRLANLFDAERAKQEAAKTAASTVVLPASGKK
jgi:hypothetical protein